MVTVIAHFAARYVRLYQRDHVSALKLSGAYEPKNMKPDNTAQTKLSHGNRKSGVQIN